MGKDKAGKDYWDEVWTDNFLPIPIDPSKTNVVNYVNLRFHDLPGWRGCQCASQLIAARSKHSRAGVNCFIVC